MMADIGHKLGRSRETDFYLIDELLTEEERGIRNKVRAFCDKEVIPIINDYWERAEVPFELIPKIAALNVAGGSIKGYGCPGMSTIAAGLVLQELSRADASLCVVFGATSSLAMTSIAMLGSEEQKQHWLPPMARLEKQGAFGLTEPDHGSDAVALETRAHRDDNVYVINGAKRWIGGASYADVTIIWARDDDGDIGAFLVEKDTPGFEAKIITGKVANRASWQADITLTDVRVPVENRLAFSRSFKDTARVLTEARCGIAWHAVGHAMAAYEIALSYARERIQFGKALASFQLIQNRLAVMLSNLTSMQLMCLRLAQLQTDGKATDGRASLAKMNNARLAREIVADAREMLGGNGILLEYHVARHYTDIEAVFTYEGTDTIQSLIVGREITGTQAFSPR